MRINYVCIKNFRNFKSCEVELGQNVILVGENKAGKSNFIEALRLVLDPSLSEMDRRLTEQDFWDGEEPFRNNKVQVTIRLTDFANDPHPDYLPLSLLSGNCIVDPGPNPVAQLTYLYFNSRELDNPEQSGPDDYDFKIYPGNNPDDSFNIREFRKNIPLQVISAIRDIARDTQSWRRSPLRQLVELTGLEVKQLQPFADRVRAVSNDVLDLDPLRSLQDSIRERLKEMVGEIYTIDPQLGLNATTAKALEQDLRLFAEGDKHRTLDRTSLGLQNALHLTLLALFLEKQQIRRTQLQERFIPIVALEESEAHLHPHLQRLVFNDFFHKAQERKQPVIISTHSPHLAGVAKVGDLVLVRNCGNQGGELRSAYSFINNLDPRERKDIDRFLDITKSEMLFSKGVILVEGDVEMLLVSNFAEILEKPLDKYGIALCNTYGTHFSLLVTLAHEFGIPFLVLTDGDPEQVYTGLERGIDTLERIKPTLSAKLKQKYDSGHHDITRKYLRWSGIFVNDWTLEPTLLEAGLHEELKKAFTELGSEMGVAVRAGSNHIDKYLKEPTPENMKNILKSIADTRWGKGRFAHRLVRHIREKASALETKESKEAIVPEYIREGIYYIVKRVEAERSQI